MYENLLALHTVDPSDQEVITVEDVYVASESVGTQSANKQAKRSRVPVEEPLKDFITGRRICCYIARRWLEPWFCAILQSATR